MTGSFTRTWNGGAAGLRVRAGRGQHRGKADEVSVLEIDGLRTFIKRRSGVVRAVDGVSFAIEPGETVGLVTRALVKLKKISTLVNRLALHTPGTGLAHRQLTPGEGSADLDALPAASAVLPPSLYVPWTKLIQMCQLRNQLTPGQPFTVLLPDMPVAPPKAAYLATLTALASWNLTDLEFLGGAQGLSNTN